VGLVGHRTKLWGLRNDPRWRERPVRDSKKARPRDNTPPAQTAPIPRQCGLGITSDDLAWQAYYRLPRAENAMLRRDVQNALSLFDENLLQELH